MAVNCCVGSGCVWVVGVYGLKGGRWQLEDGGCVWVEGVCE